MFIKYIKYFIFLLALFLFSQSFFYYAKSATISEQDTVNINALVPAEEITPGPGGGGGGIPPASDTVPPIISNIKIDSITANSARVSWSTNELAVPQINYGKTASFDKTFIGGSFSLENSIFLENLSAGTAYFFEIIAIDRGGNRSIAKDLSFTTLAEPDNIPPANVSRFKAIAWDSEVNLSWQNPADPDFQAVKIFRSEKFYPKDLEDGVLIYDSNGNSFTDKNLVNGTVYYYTAFAYDKSGNYSSGAVAKAMPQKPGLPSPSPSVSPAPSGTVGPSPSVSPSPEIVNLKLEDFSFSQGAGNLKITGGKIEVESGKSLVVSIDSRKVPELIGTMMFILAQDGEPESFLFKSDANKNEYSVSFEPPALGGVYSLTIALLDKNNNPVQAIGGNLIVNVAEKPAEKPSWLIDLLWIFLIIFIIMVLRAAWKLIRKMREENKRKKEKNKL